MKIKVTIDDINNGIAGSVRSCPVAQALARQLTCPVEVLHATFRWQGKHHTLPHHVTEFIVNFDGGCEVKPFNFELESTWKL